MKKNEAENTQGTTEKKDTRMTNLLVILTAVVFAAIAAVVLFVPGLELKPEYLGYLIGAALVIVGIVFIVRYFVTDAYKNMNAYGFSAGTLLVILGICALLRADAIGIVFDLVLGIAVLLMGIIILQHSLDLKRMSDFMWVIALISSLLAVACGVIMILKPSPEKIDYAKYNWWAVLISSGLGFIFNIYTLIRVAIFNKHEKKTAEQEAKDRETAAAAAAQAEAGTSTGDVTASTGDTGATSGTSYSDTSYAGTTPTDEAYTSRTTDMDTGVTPADAIMGALSAIGEQEISGNASADPETYEAGSGYDDYSNRVLSYDLKSGEAESPATAEETGYGSGESTDVSDEYASISVTDATDTSDTE